ncbi:MAG: 16S rRNA (cytidine(1402)-2'-O)-methyltransferase, partial [Proteobacteria bacterium]|nr:16S rRNA (cytidine(1402)-2'-O)-methyltransferase [Pseudomonadota bacterium]
MQPGLYLVATPIGHAQDITLRALQVLRDADVLFCEDTRRLQKLLTIHGIKGKKLLAAHAHNEQVSAALIGEKIREGKSVAYASDAGLPLISDPGAAMVTYLAKEGLAVTSLPGANAALTALQLSGLPALPFTFVGFLPPKSSARKRALQSLKKLDSTVVFYEAPHRILETLEDLREVFGNREAALCRELTKMHEEVLRGKFEALSQILRNRASIKGEIVLVVNGAGLEEEEAIDQNEIDRLLLEARKTLSAKDAAAIMSGRTGLPKRELYQRLLHLHDES